VANEINKADPPALPLHREEFERSFFDQFNNILRLFFNRLTGTLDSLLSTTQGGRFLYMPNALFYSTTDQTAAATNTGYAVAFENTYLANGIEINGGSSTQVTVSADGVYNFQITLQTAHTNSSAVQIWTWISKNGTPVTYGGQQQTIVGNANQPVFWNFSIDLTAGQYIEMYWATADLSLSLDSTAPTSPHPGIPSAIVAVSFVSNY
jgi:hypothetical protein